MPTTARPTRRSRSTRACPTRGRRSCVTSARGTMHLRIEVRSADNDLHSGAGNTVLNAAHVLHRVLAAVLPRRRRPAARRRCAPAAVEPTDAERDGWRRLPGRRHRHRAARRPPARPRRRRRPLPAHRVRAGDRRARHRGGRRATRCARRSPPPPARCCRCVSRRARPARRSGRCWSGCCAAAVPAGADVQITLNNACEPARVDPGHPVTQIARRGAGARGRRRAGDGAGGRVAAGAERASRRAASRRC